MVREAQEALARLRNGPRPEEIAEVRVRVREAEAGYQKLAAGARPEEIAQARAEGRNARARLAQAQRGPTREERAQLWARLNAASAEDLARKDFDRYSELLGVILQLVIVSLTSFSLVRERKRGTLDQLMVSSVERVGLMSGKLVPYAVLAMGELFLVLFVAGLVFNVHSAGSLALLLTLSAPIILAALSIRLLISTIAQNQAQALQMTLLTVLPSILLSGYIAPRDTLPAPLYVLSGVLPVTYFIQIVRGIMVRDASLADVMPSVVALLVLTLLLLTAAMIRFRKSSA